LQRVSYKLHLANLKQFVDIKSSTSQILFNRSQLNGFALNYVSEYLKND